MEVGALEKDRLVTVFAVDMDEPFKKARLRVLANILEKELKRGRKLDGIGRERAEDCELARNLSIL